MFSAKEATVSAARLMGFDKVYTVCINPSVCNKRILQIPDMKTLTRKHKKRRELLIQKEAVCVYRLIQTA